MAKRISRVTVTYHDLVEDEFLSSGEMREIMQRVGDEVARDAAENAPKRTTLGAESIAARTKLTSRGWEVDVSWSRRHYYLTFHENGTVRLRKRPFLVPALQRQQGKF